MRFWFLVQEFHRRTALKSRQLEDYANGKMLPPLRALAVSYSSWIPGTQSTSISKVNSSGRGEHDFVWGGPSRICVHFW